MTTDGGGWIVIQRNKKEQFSWTLIRTGLIMKKDLETLTQNFGMDWKKYIV